ncbi:hypothetical protein FDECE_11276 [Fusarium decemcellulare]|nr:hypothetical protein FDECE_11276 [Fusarium decemcellulare]
MSDLPSHTEPAHTDTGILPPQYWAQLTEEIDEQDDADSAVSGSGSSTASLTSSILKYRTVHGRTYHSERGNAEYWYTHQFTNVAGALIDIIGQAAVDIGTGTDDCTQEWTLEPSSLDYVHMRWLVGSIKDWTALFKEAYKILKPGGYVESYEPSSRIESDDGTVLKKSALSQWEKFFVEGGRKLGRPFTIFEDGIQREAMREAGFVDIEERDFKASLIYVRPIIYTDRRLIWR